MGLDDRDDRPADCHRGAVQGVHVAGSVGAEWAVTTVDAACLVIGRVRAARHLAVAATGGARPPPAPRAPAPTLPPPPPLLSLVFRSAAPPAARAFMSQGGGGGTVERLEDLL